MSRMIFYRHTKEGRLAEKLYALTTDRSEKIGDELIEAASELFELAVHEGYVGNLWHRLLTEALVYDENPYTVSSERRGKVEGSIRDAIMKDLNCFHEMFATDIFSAPGVEDVFGDKTQYLDYKPTKGSGMKYNPVIRSEINELSVKLATAASAEEMRDLLEEFYKKRGVGVFGLHKAFRVGSKTDNGGVAANGNGRMESLEVYPIYNIAVTSLDDLVGYESQKEQLRDNTEAFLEGRKANNCLLYGEAGTGKSSSIRAILNEYYDRGLRMIEVYKHQYSEINTLIDRLKNRNYRFIIYMDDLSFEEFEVEYKYLKAVLEGGLESRPDNVLIYATSNRRHLVRENFSDREERDDDKHANETVQEKISLCARFGLSIYYGSPEQEEFFKIVEELAARYGIDKDKETLRLEANRWEITHNGFSGRTATQFIDHLRGKAGTV
ncbi:MAG: ATP-binding protein [Lachnospiraceae bacterium]|nr:ATP-binding protein [Lachnospiraceae bacterium]